MKLCRSRTGRFAFETSEFDTTEDGETPRGPAARDRCFQELVRPPQTKPVSSAPVPPPRPSKRKNKPKTCSDLQLFVPSSREEEVVKPNLGCVTSCIPINRILSSYEFMQRKLL